MASLFRNKIGQYKNKQELNHSLRRECSNFFQGRVTHRTKKSIKIKRALNKSIFPFILSNLTKTIL